MSQSTLSVRMDSNTKKEFDAFCAGVGMNASVAVNLFAKAVIRERRIPFVISDVCPFTDVYSKLEAAEIDVSEGRVADARGVLKELKSKYGL